VRSARRLMGDEHMSASRSRSRRRSVADDEPRDAPCGCPQKPVVVCPPCPCPPKKKKKMKKKKEECVKPVKKKQC